jgi:hypothetical protein
LEGLVVVEVAVYRDVQLVIELRIRHKNSIRWKAMDNVEENTHTSGMRTKRKATKLLYSANGEMHQT